MGCNREHLGSDQQSQFNSRHCGAVMQLLEFYF